MALGQPLDSASQSIVIARSKATKQSRTLLCLKKARLLRRFAPRNDSQVGWANGIIVCPR